MDMFQESIDRTLSKVTEWRRHLHTYPELSFQEFKTTEYIIDQIKQLPGVTWERLTETGVVARFSCDRPGPVIAMRGDIDALPVQEESGVSFTSACDGVMHACGHDSHAALLLGALYVLYESRSNLKGSFVFLFQPAEEKFPGGARALIEKGALDGVDAIIGQHTGSDFPTGHIATKPGPISANSDVFTLTIQGRGGHASAPQQCLDPLPVGAQIVTALQQVISRRVSPNDQAVLSITTFHCGTVDNVIADTAELSGTVRTYKAATRNLIEQSIKEISERYALCAGMTAECVYRRGYDSTCNTPVFANALLEVARELYGPEAVELAQARMGGEDFGYYLQKVPGCFYYFGIKSEEAKSTYPNHNAHFRIDERSFEPALSVMVHSAVRFQQIIEQEKK